MGMIDRKVEIEQKVKRLGRVSVSELAEGYGVSTMTIRRDLARLEQEGLVTVEYGGAILKQRSLVEADMNQKQAEYPEEKKCIARAALEFVQDGDSVFVDARHHHLRSSPFAESTERLADHDELPAGGKRSCGKQ